MRLTNHLSSLSLILSTIPRQQRLFSSTAMASTSNNISALDADGQLLFLPEPPKVSRISNWQQMIDLEKKNTLRILGKRNQLRMEASRGKDEGVEGKREL